MTATKLRTAEPQQREPRDGPRAWPRLRRLGLPWPRLALLLLLPPSPSSSEGGEKYLSEGCGGKGREWQGCWVVGEKHLSEGGGGRGKAGQGVAGLWGCGGEAPE